MLESAIAGLLAATHWPAIGYLFAGIALGIYFGAVPGLSGLSGMAILLPFTFGMDHVSAFSFLLGMYAVTTTSDSVTAILIGVPGTAAAQATVLDGYPMAKRGEAARAFGAAFTCSMIGGVLGAIIMGLSIPIVQPVVLSFAKPEFFMLGLLGLTMVGALSGRSILKGLTAAGLGLLLSQVGYAEQIAIPRYWMGFTYLLDGLPLVPVVLGLFALPELVSLAVSEGSISEIPREQVSGGIRAGMRDALTNWWLLLRSSVIGVYVGMLPALGSTIADWVAYGHAVQSAKDKSQFGKGDVRGVIAPEAANNSCKGGELVPTVAFGIPGSAPMAILLGAFLIQGLTPGPEMLTTKLHVTFGMMWSLIFANIIAAVLLLAWANQLQRIIFIPAHLVIPGITFFVLMGAWTAGNNIGDWITLLVFTVVGIVMKRAGWPRPPLVLGYILGRIMENSLHISMKAYGLSWIYRPICIVLAIVIVFTIFFAIRSHLRTRAQPDAPTVSDADGGDTRLSLGFAVVVFLVLGGAIVATIPWPPSVRLFPLVFSIPAIVLAGFAIAADWRALRSAPALAAPQGAAAATGFAGLPRDLLRSCHFFAWLVGILVVTVVAGQHVALPLFMALYLVVWGKYNWMLALAYAACGLAVLIGVFDYLSPTVWYPDLLSR
jgi:putative tricarboxylic transport membrane protein